MYVIILDYKKLTQSDKVIPGLPDITLGLTLLSGFNLHNIISQLPGIFPINITPTFRNIHTFTCWCMQHAITQGNGENIHMDKKLNINIKKSGYM